MNGSGKSGTVDAPDGLIQTHTGHLRDEQDFSVEIAAIAGNGEQQAATTAPDVTTIAQERALVEEAKHSAEAFGKLYRQYVNRIYNYHYRHTGNHVEAEDLTSRTFYCALRSIQQYKDRGGTFQAWLFRIAHNAVVNWYRDQSRHAVVSLEASDQQVGQSVHRDEPHEQAVRREQQAIMLRLFNQLPEMRKTLLILKFVEKMSNEEIAKVLGKSEGAIKSLYHRTLIELREAILQGELADGL
ncbi:MAG TPA: sigma-70 family RNA polymerase sigma factor [Anaerolineae bacterium]|nr:sigma-70 family RNA polymerase sigma factor [Anaerolineae bacterium]HQK14436.1 sigma-70 family RNA polymerase sigma factor [Anaerolineae bacterium]